MRRCVERCITPFSWCCTAICFLALASILAYLLWKGVPVLGWELIFADTPPLDALLLKRQVFDGLFPAMAGTVALVCISLLVALPVGLAAGIYMAEYAHGLVKSFLSLFFDILAGLPSVVIGLAGFSLSIALHRLFPHKFGPCLLLSGLCLGLLVLPYLIRSTQSALEAVPSALRLTAPSLGATKLQNLSRVLLPFCTRDLLGGVILALGRTAEDTAVIMLTGVVASAGVPRSVLEQFEALPFYIYYISSQYTDTQELERGFGAAVILLALCVVLFCCAFFVQRRVQLHFSGARER